LLNPILKPLKLHQQKAEVKSLSKVQPIFYNGLFFRYPISFSTYQNVKQKKAAFCENQCLHSQERGLLYTARESMDRKLAPSITKASQVYTYQQRDILSHMWLPGAIKGKSPPTSKVVY